MPDICIHQNTRFFLVWFPDAIQIPVQYSYAIWFSVQNFRWVFTWPNCCANFGLFILVFRTWPIYLTFRKHTIKFVEYWTIQYLDPDYSEDLKSGSPTIWRPAKMAAILNKLLKSWLFSSDFKRAGLFWLPSWIFPIQKQIYKKSGWVIFLDFECLPLYIAINSLNWQCDQ